VCGSYLSRADFGWVNVRQAFSELGDIPVLSRIDAVILQEILRTTDGVGIHYNSQSDLSGHEANKQQYPESRNTRATWAVQLCGEAGLKLAELVGTECAGALIYAANRPDRQLPDFDENMSSMLADLKDCCETVEKSEKARDRQKEDRLTPTNEAETGPTGYSGSVQ